MCTTAIFCGAHIPVHLNMNSFCKVYCFICNTYFHEFTGHLLNLMHMNMYSTKVNVNVNPVSRGPGGEVREAVEGVGDVGE